MTSVPLSGEGFVLPKKLFWDLIYIRFGRTLTRLLSTCECGIKFNIQHALSCEKGIFVSLRYNRIRNKSRVLKEGCKDVCVYLEP